MIQKKLLFSLFLFSSILSWAQVNDSGGKANIDMNASVQCLELFTDIALLPKQTMQLLLEVHRSWVYGVEILERTLPSGQKRWLVMVSEDRYKKEQSQKLGQRLLKDYPNPIFADSETLDTLPLGRLHQVFPVLARVLNPVDWFMGREERLALSVPAIDETKWDPSRRAQLGWGLDASKSVIKLLAATTAWLYFLDFLFETTMGWHFQARETVQGLLPDTQFLNEIYSQVQLLRRENPALAGAAVFGIFMAIKHSKALGTLYPAYAFRQERGVFLAHQIEDDFAANPGEPVRLFIHGGLSKGPLMAEMMNSHGYRLIGSDELYALAYTKHELGYIGRLMQPIRRLFSRWEAALLRKTGGVGDN